MADARASLVSEAYARVRSAILSGELPAGAVTSQAAIVRDLDISRTPLREALRILQREGLVEVEHQQRLRIAPFSLDDLDELYALRIVAEPLAVALTVAAMTPQERAAVRGHHEAMEATPHDDLAAWERAHKAFHGALRAGGGRRMREQLDELADHAERYRRFHLAHGEHGWSASARDHRRILEAAEAGDAAGAAAETAAHLAHTALAVATIADPLFEPRRVRVALAAASAGATAARGGAPSAAGARR